ncbi:MAG: hypothetical protein JO263_03650 [Candidatus Eremiobacteraeota bacterium]|nr:hypothetical protein [Candidatus Eremiobacteraeota bacterium]
MFRSPLRRRTLPAAILFAGLAGLAGCAGSSASGGFNPAVQTAAAGPQTIEPAIIKHWLYITDGSSNSVKILKSTTYKKVGTITSGISGPAGDWLDNLGNLYVANASAGTVTEYAQGAATPSLTYNQNMHVPNAVTTDLHGNVYEADLGAGSNQGEVNEYFPTGGVVSCPPGLHSGGNTGAYGVAVDKKGDVFVTYGMAGSGGAAIDEFQSGISPSCNDYKLPITYSSPGGIAIDSAGDLVVCDPQSSIVYVIPPPYITVPRTIGSGFSKPTQVTLSKDNTRAFVTDAGNHTVTIVDYQTGANIQVLGTANGLSAPNGAVGEPNAVY